MNRDPLIGRRFANYQIESLLGRGGMAQVYFARDISLHRPVAVKVIDAQFRQDVSYAQRFISEARAVATWRHENIIQVYYAGQEDDLYYFVMEYIDGLNLESLLRHYADSGELMPHEDVLKIGKAVASALDYAHSKGVVHRDVKPSNVMISSDDRVVLADFGLALDTQQGSMGEVFGTPHYVSPEQAMRSANAVPQSDVYSLGVMLYEMLTGLVPFDDPSAASLALQHLTLPPPSPRSLNPELNQATEDVLLKALAKKPEERFTTAMELLNSLEKALQQPPDKLITAELPPLPPGMEAPRRSLSSHTVTQRVAAHVQATHTHPMPMPPRIRDTREQPAMEAAAPVASAVHTAPPAAPPVMPQSATSPAKKSPLLMMIVGGIVVLLIGAVVVFASGMLNPPEDVLPTEVVLNTAIPTEVAAVAQVTNTDLPTDLPTQTTAPPTDLPTNTAVPPTDLPTNTAVPPTDLPTNTAVPPTPIPAQPTVLYPDGRLIQFIWDDNSFYWLNRAGESLRVSSILFEALTDSGANAGFSLEGSRWALSYNLVENGKCDAVEITQGTPLRPGQCAGYNAYVTPQRSSPLVFWIPRDGVNQFRVVWNGEEVGRCMIAARSCEVRIP